jgi:hypothetical protein
VHLRVPGRFFSRENRAKARYTRVMLRRLVPILLVLSTVALAQNAPNPKEYVSSQFGEEFVLLDRFPMLTGDLDGDGTEDAVFVATRKGNPLVDEQQFHYKVIDPYDEYFGWGDPRVTSTFNTHDPEQIKYILIVHDWHAAVPKSKLVVLNLPFEKLGITRIPTKKKKIVTAITAEDLGGTTSAIYWDGKKYRWTAMSGMD